MPSPAYGVTNGAKNPKHESDNKQQHPKAPENRNPQKESQYHEYHTKSNHDASFEGNCNIDNPCRIAIDHSVFKMLFQVLNFKLTCDIEKRSISKRAV